MITDKYATAEAYYGLARAYSNVPDLHIMWLLYLCEVHQGNQSYAEAAQCAVAVAGVIMQVFALINWFFCLSCVLVYSCQYVNAFYLPFL